MDHTQYSQLNRLNENEKYELTTMMLLDRFLFAKIILGDKELGDMHYHFRDASPEFHKIINSDLELLQPGDKYALQAPREHAKTTILTLLYPLHSLTYDNMRFLLMISESEQQSMLNLETLGNEVEFNPKYKFFFGDRMGSTWGKESKLFITKFNKDRRNSIARILIRGVGQKVRGLKFGAWRPDVIIDDGEGEANTLTIGQREKFCRWLDAVVIPGCADGILVMGGTILDEEAYLNTVAGSAAWFKGKYKIKGWKHRFFQAILQDTEPGEFIGEGKEILDKNGVPKVLWPERKSYEWLKNRKEELKSQGRIHVFFQEYQGIAITDAFRIFKKIDIQYWDGDVAYDDELKTWFLSLKEIKGRFTHEDIDIDEAFPVNIFIGVDPASSENVRADYTVVMVVAVDNRNNAFVIEYFRGQVNPMDGATELWKRMVKYQPKIVNIEKTGHEMLAPYMFVKSKEAGHFFNIQPRDAIGNKVYRIMELQPRCAQGAVFFKEDMSQFESEILALTKGGKTKKDTLEAFYWALKESYKPELEKVKEKYQNPDEDEFEIDRSGEIDVYPE
ncbi:hypothetical protein LCGC14_0364880 [marine sediment metagenome]|uniref:Terminase large subunit gp17-like C-terminal domain-containing protein n=1 Tax=marine sediment metagenome TaxID=412755 RepID=A0A0F9VU56_9ZZZZ